MSVIRDLSGQKFGRLTALYPTEKRDKRGLKHVEKRDKLMKYAVSAENIHMKYAERGGAIENCRQGQCVCSGI